jgi:hypothetical protein
VLVRVLAGEAAADVGEGCLERRATPFQLFWPKTARL